MVKVNFKVFEVWSTFFFGDGMAGVNSFFVHTEKFIVQEKYYGKNSRKKKKKNPTICIKKMLEHFEFVNI